jgi:hypothetical protein
MAWHKWRYEETVEKKRRGDVVGSSILATNNAYGHSRPVQTML